MKLTINREVEVCDFCAADRREDTYNKLYVCLCGKFTCKDHTMWCARHASPDTSGREEWTLCPDCLAKVKAFGKDAKA